jgi:hypothetical protein
MRDVRGLIDEGERWHLDELALTENELLFLRRLLEALIDESLERSILHPAERALARINHGRVV